MQLHCARCLAPIDPIRAMQSTTCSAACRNAINKQRRAIRDQKKCHICGKPSTPEERVSYALWRREKLGKVKRRPGRPPKAKAAAAEEACIPDETRVEV